MKKLLFALLLLGSSGAFAQRVPKTKPAPRVAAPPAPVREQPSGLPEAAPQLYDVNPKVLQRIDQLLEEYTADGREPGAIALIARDGKIMYRKAFGYDDVATKKPLRTDAIVRIASQTKAVTSVGVMMLYEEGKFKLDDPISKYLPAFRNQQVLATFNERDSSYTTVPARSEVTIRQLLTHTSGIGYPIIGSKEARAIYAKAHVPSGIGIPGGRLAPAIDALGPLPLMHQPGERFTYGLSVDVLGRLIEVLSGQPLDQFLRTRIFEPLEMRDTYFYLPPAKQPRLATLYTEDATHRTVKMPPQGGMRPDYPKAQGTYFSGGAGLSSTIDDYAVFLQMLLNGGTYHSLPLLQPATVQLMTSNQIGDVNQGLNKFGLGFSITTAQSSAQTGQAVGTYEWGGIFGTTYWVDPVHKVVVLLYTQKYPNTSAADLVPKFKKLVYQAMTEH